MFFAPTSTEAAALIIEQAASQGLEMPIMAGDYLGFQRYP